MATALPSTAPVVTKEDILVSAAPSSSSGMFAPVTNIYNRLQAWRQSLDLPNPGTIENLQKEVKCTSFYPAYSSLKLMSNFTFCSLPGLNLRCTYAHVHHAKHVWNEQQHS